MVPVPYSRGRSISYSDRFHDFSVNYKDVYVNSFFLRTARLRNFVPIECFSLTYDLNGFKPGNHRHFFSVGSI